jgi:4-hydroxy-tetrahydrodipicolinate reductase
MERVRVVIAGAGGRMGRALIEAVLAAPGLALAAALDVAGSPMHGHDAGEHCGRATGVVVGSDIDAAVDRADVLVDFTRPEGTLSHLAACARRKVAAVVGTTGLSDAQKAKLVEHARAIPIVFAANMSVGVNVLLSMANDWRVRWG